MANENEACEDTTSTGSTLSRRELARRMVAATGGAAAAAILVSARTVHAAPRDDRKLLIERIVNTRYVVDQNSDGDDYINVWQLSAGLDRNEVHPDADAHRDWMFVDDQSVKNLRGKRNGAMSRNIQNADGDVHTGRNFNDNYELDRFSEAIRSLDSEYWRLIFNDDESEGDYYLHDVYHVMRAKILFEMDHARVDGIARFLRHVDMQGSFPQNSAELQQMAADFVACAENYYGETDYLNGEYDFADYVARYTGQDPCLRHNAGFPQGESWY